MSLQSTQPNRCKHCKQRMPADKAHHVIHNDCIEPWLVLQNAKQAKTKALQGRSQARLERAATRQRKEKLKTIANRIAEAQVAFNAFIRERDRLAGHACISSGRALDWSGNKTDAGHYRSTGAASHLRFNEDNCHAQSKQDNRYLSGNAVDYRIGLIQRIGLDRVETLESDNAVHKWTHAELANIKPLYVAKLKNLKASAA